MLKMTKATACIAEQINQQGEERREEDPAATIDPSSCWRWTLSDSDYLPTSAHE